MPMDRSELTSFLYPAVLNCGAKALVYPLERKSTKSIANQHVQASLFKNYFARKNFNGLGVALVASALRGGLTAYAGKKAYDGFLEGHRWANLGTGLCMGVVEALLHPLINVKIIMQSTNEQLGVKKALRQLGWENLYRGSMATGLRNIAWHVINTPLFGWMSTPDDSIPTKIAKGVLSSQGAATCSYPLCYIAVRQAQMSSNHGKASIGTVVKETWQKLGALGFFRGYRHAALRMTLCSVIIGPITSRILAGKQAENEAVPEEPTNPIPL